ncbi:DUF2997 domain-containing protein [Oceanisphaera sp. W20_SRM_FM3]|uniref:DUF2997 domain-containing protein n=1 Tax=Oceanisphaera sp. W20_SRM_FM3 TaxID=3240267 RepID=UPI003F95CA7C
MPEQIIVITIDDDGGITAKTSGFKGETCLGALNDLLELDAGVTELNKTDEYHQKQSLKQSSLQKIERK